MKTTEAQEQQKLIQWLRLKKIFHFAINNENQQSSTNKMMAIRIAQKAKAMGKIKGASDLVVMLQDVILFIELKSAPRKLKSGKYSISHTKVSDEQKSFLSEVDKFRYADSRVCYGFDESVEFIESWF